jgi:hypothetical protein
MKTMMRDGYQPYEPQLTISAQAEGIWTVDETTCDAYVPLSYSQGLLHFWEQAAGSLAG